MSFDPSNCSLKIWKSLGTLIPQSESPLENVWAHSLTFFHNSWKCECDPRLRFQPSPFHALCFGHELKVAVVIHTIFVFKQCAQYQCSNNTSKWMTSMFTPYEPMKNRFRTIIITKWWPIKFMMWSLTLISNRW
jgi:hypothetical protein